MSEWWEYDILPSSHPYDWSPATRGERPDDQIDFHLDLGCGTVPKGRLGIDRYGDSNRVLLLDLNKDRLPFPDNSIHSIITHHCLEHIGDGFIPLMDECYRVLMPDALFRIIVPCFPSVSAVVDPDHKRFFMPETFNYFVHDAGPDTPFWTESFSVPYTSCRFKLKILEYTPAQKFFDGREFSIDDLFREPREIRVTLQK